MPRRTGGTCGRCRKTCHSTTGPRAGGTTTRSGPWWPRAWAGCRPSGSASARRCTRGRAPSPTSIGRRGPWPASLRGAGRRPGRRGRAPAPELGGGRHHLLGGDLPGCGGGAHRALLRRQGGRLHPPGHLAGGGGDRGPVRPQRLPGHLRVPARRPIPTPGGWWCGDTPASPRCRRGPTPFESMLDGAPLTEPRGGRPRRAGRSIGVHLGHHPGPEGRGALPPHDRLRDPPARLPVPQGRATADHRGAGRALHRHAQRLPGAAAARATGQPASTSGTRARCCG